SEIFEHLDGKMPLANAIEEIKKNTRKYAKRQMTWFKKDKEIKWINAKQTGGIVSMAQNLVQTDRTEKVYQMRIFYLLRSMVLITGLLFNNYCNNKAESKKEEEGPKPISLQ